jgi:hypothetical protein
VYIDGRSVMIENEIKQRILEEIEKNADMFRKVGKDAYVIRCPLCGDSQKDFKATHMYLKCSDDFNEPILYNCFKCNKGGRVNKWFLEKLNISPEMFQYDDKLFNKVSSAKKLDIDILTGKPNMNSDQAGYIEYRLGDGFSADDFDRFKIVWDMKTILPYISNARIRNTLPSNLNSISFLSEDKSVLITRFFSDGHPRWKKTKLFSSTGKSIYTIKSTLDLFTKDTITINIAEGIFDILSIYKNFTDNINSVYIAVIGSDYESGLSYAINNGFVGSNIIVNIYADNDIDDKLLRYKLKRYKWLFDRICVIKNIRSNDFGTLIENIRISQYQL